MSEILLTKEMKMFLACSHESDLINFKLNDDKYIFRFAMPGINACNLNKEIKADYNEHLIIDVIFNNPQIKYLCFPFADFRFITSDVLSFSLDDNNDFCLWLNDGESFGIKFHSEKFEVIQKQIITLKQLNQLHNQRTDVVDIDFFEIK
jgi:hypothetical protein